MIEGTNIGQYRVLRKIGEGGMGAVYLAEHMLIGRQAAIKVLLPQLSMQREIVERFFNEARATTAIPDPGIVQVFDFGLHTDGSAYIVMEFLEGEPLDARMKRVGRLTPFDALRITRQCAGSLNAAHQRGIVHRDLKPENIFLVRDQEAQGGERPKVLDFGIAKLGGNDPNQMRTRTGAMMGTPVYMSPEQCRGAGFVDHRADIYSLGCVLFHMLTGRPPFEAEGIGEVIAAHLREPPRAPSALILGLPDGVDQLVMGCLVKAVEERFQTMADLQRACDALMARITQSGATVPTVANATPVPPGFRSEYPGTAHAHLSLAHATQPPPAQPTTLGSAAGQASPSSGAKRRGGLIALVVTCLVGGGVAAVVVMGGGKGDAAPDPAAAGALDAQPGSGSVAAATPDAGVAATPEDAAVATTPPPDADVAVAASPPDAGAEVADGDGEGSGSGSGKKKRRKKSGSGSGSSQEDLYGDR